MKDKVLEILQMPKNEGSINLLCTTFGIRKFQANNIMDEYKKIYDIEVSMLEKGMDTSMYALEKQNIIKGLTSGEYSKPEVIKEALKNEVINILQSPKTDDSVNKLSYLCEIDLTTANSKIDEYQNILNQEKQMMMSGQNTNSLSEQKWAIINELSELK